MILCFVKKIIVYEHLYKYNKSITYLTILSCFMFHISVTTKLKEIIIKSVILYIYTFIKI